EGSIWPPVLSRGNVYFAGPATLIFFTGRSVGENNELYLVLADGGLSRKGPVRDPESAGRSAVYSKVELTGLERLTVHLDGPLDAGCRWRTRGPGAAKGKTDERQSETA